MLTTFLLEGISGTLFALAAFANFMFGLYIVREVVERGFVRKRLQGGIAIFSLFLGLAILSGWVWLWCHLTNRGGSTNWMGAPPVLPIGAGVLTVATVCVIRVFAPDGWGRYVWFVSALVAVGVVTAFTYL